MKKIVVRVIPSCISINREEEYIIRTQRAYKENRLENNMKVIEETESKVVINFYR